MRGVGCKPTPAAFGVYQNVGFHDPGRGQTSQRGCCRTSAAMTRRVKYRRRVLQFCNTLVLSQKTMLKRCGGYYAMGVEYVYSWDTLAGEECEYTPVGLW